MKGVLQITFNFVEDIFGSSAKQNCASFGIFTFFNKSEVFITDFSHFKESSTGTNIILRDFISTVDNGSSTSTGNT